MSDADKTAGSENASSDPFMMVRMGILGTILVVALAGLGWEYLLVVPGFNNAQKGLSELSDENITLTAADAKTRADVMEIIGSKVAETEINSPDKKKDGDDKSLQGWTYVRHDKYSWYHALPWKEPETITVIYKRLMKEEADLDQEPESFPDEEWKFSAVYFNEDPPMSATSPVPKDAKNPGDTPGASGAGFSRGNRGSGGKSSSDSKKKEESKDSDAKKESSDATSKGEEKDKAGDDESTGKKDDSSK